MKANHLLTGALLALVPALALTAPGVAHADTITLNTPSAAFSNPTGGSNISYPDPNEIRWGTPTTTGKNPDGLKSGLRFDPFTAPLVTTTGGHFNLGTLTHYNWEVKNGTAISAVDLTFSFSINGATPSNVSFTFNLGVDETDNHQTGCTNTPVPSGNWCPDIISFPQMSGTSTFTLDGKNYTLNLLGFGQTYNDLSNDFITQEFANTSTHLWASITTPGTNVPEPGSLLMMGFGLLSLLGFVGLRRKFHNDRARG